MIIVILLVQLKEQKNSRELTGTVTGKLLVGIYPENCAHFQIFPEQFLNFLNYIFIPLGAEMDLIVEMKLSSIIEHTSEILKPRFRFKSLR